MVSENHLSNYMHRKKYWFFNACFSTILRLSYPFRDKKTWVFSAWDGERYDDNSRYLYEFVLNRDNNINAVWITRNNDVIEYLKSRDLPVLHCDSKEGRKTMLKAGVAFYTNGLDDFSRICYLYGATIINLGHAAASIKKTGIYINNYPDFLFKRYLKLFKDRLFSWYYFTYIIATSKESAQSKVETYNCCLKKVIISGMPRNDVFKKKFDGKLDLKQEKKDDYHYILYLPTYRLYSNNIVADFIESINRDEEFRLLLKENKYKLIIKLHNADKLSSADSNYNSEVILLKNRDVSSTQELLAISDILITDFSSCVIDFAITMKQILLYAPDYDQYNTNNGIVQLWDNIYKSEIVIKSIDELKNQLSRMIIDKKYDYFLNQKFNNIYQDSSIVNTTFSENIYNFLCNKIGV